MNHCDKSDKKKDAPLILGITFSVLQVLIFFTFILLCVFGAKFLNTNFMGSGIPLSFVMGFFVIISGVILTVVYVFIANGQEGN